MEDQERQLADNANASVVMRCPATSRHEGDIVGCGSTNIVEDASEPSMFDCLACGLFFTRAAAEYGEQQKPENKHRHHSKHA